MNTDTATNFLLLGLFGKKKNKDDQKDQNEQPAAQSGQPGTNENQTTKTTRQDTSGISSEDKIREVENHIYELLKQVIDPEIGLDIINLGLVYNIVYDGKKHIYIEMTLSTPACPLSDALVSNVKNIIQKYYPGYTADVELTFDPPWDTSMISDEGKKFLGMN